MGLSEMLGEADISKGVQEYIPNKLNWDIWDFNYPFIPLTHV